MLTHLIEGDVYPSLCCVTGKRRRKAGKWMRRKGRSEERKSETKEETKASRAKSSFQARRAHLILITEKAKSAR